MLGSSSGPEAGSRERWYLVFYGWLRGFLLVGFYFSLSIRVFCIFAFQWFLVHEAREWVSGVCKPVNTGRRL